MTTIEGRKLFNKLLELMFDINNNWDVGIRATVSNGNRFFYRFNEKLIAITFNNEQLKESEVEIEFGDGRKNIIIDINKLERLLLFYLVLLD